MQSLNDVIFNNESPSQIKFDPDKNNPTYIGINQSLEAATSNTDWKIIYMESDTSIKFTKGSWEDRATLF